MAKWTNLRRGRKLSGWRGKSSTRGPDIHYKDYLRGSSGSDPTLVERWFTRKERNIRRAVKKGKYIDPDVQRPEKREFQHVVINQAFTKPKPPQGEIDTIHPRVRVIEAWQSALRGQGIAEYNRVTFLDGEQVKLYLFFSGLKFFFKEYDLFYGTARESITYKSHDRAKRAFESNGILWIKKEDLQ